jgi:hypothetical protein
MPGRDGTGPMGQGSRTGRGMGNCSPTAGATNRSFASSPTRPLGLGRGWWGSTFGRLFGPRRGRGRFF